MNNTILIHALLFLAFWLTNLPYQRSLNDFLVSATGRRLNFLLIFVAFAGLMALWSGTRKIGRARWVGPAWVYHTVGILFLIFFYGSFAFLFLNNPAQLYRLGQLFQYFRLIIDAAVLLGLVWGLRRWIKTPGTMKKALLSAALLIAWLIPVIYPPLNVYSGLVPEKPRLIAHRGAAALAPENTLAAMQAAAELGVYSLETDISISADGVPFLIHDATLARTTDVEQVFPGRGSAAAETFTWAELSQLNAGRWFDGWASHPAEPVSNLDAVLRVMKEKDLYLIYDLRIPAEDHAYASRALDLCLEKIRAAGVADHAWILAKPDEIAHIRAILPEATLAAGIGYKDRPPAPADLAAAGYKVVNSVYSLPDHSIHDYQAAGLWVNLWLVDEPWQYARLWLAGVNSVTTNDVQTLAAMTYPFAALPYPVYLIIWGLVGLLVAWLYVSEKPCVYFGIIGASLQKNQQSSG